MIEIESGVAIDGFVVGECVHAGAMGRLFRAKGPHGGEDLAMKVPRLGQGDSAELLLGFETEAMILPMLSGAHVPRFVAAGDVLTAPYLVTHWVGGESLDRRLTGKPLPVDEVARLGAAIADALHSLHRQDVIHCDLKPDNVMIRPDGVAVLVDFGLAHHARLPDLLAQEQRFAAGSAPYISPEQVFGNRADPRSDLFALGVLLYELATGRFPFGTPATPAGLKDRLWLDPRPPRLRNPEVTPWLQEVILRCLETDPEDRYQTAGHVAFDLRHPDQVSLTARSRKSEQAGFFGQMARWWRSRGEKPAPRSPRIVADSAPVIMVPVDTMNPEDERHPVLRATVQRILSLPGEFRLICVTVIPGGPGDANASDPTVEHHVRLRHWVEPLRLPAQRLSLHVIEGSDPAQAILDFARVNLVDLIVIGAPGPGEMKMAWWRSVASSVTANAACSVHVVRVPEERAG